MEMEVLRWNTGLRGNGMDEVKQERHFLCDYMHPGQISTFTLLSSSVRRITDEGALIGWLRER